MRFLKARFVFPRQDAARPHGFRAALERSRLAAKDKTLPRVLDGYSAHPRTPNMCFGRACLQRAFSFRRYLRREVALQQPKVAAQLPTGGNVSTPCPCVAWRFSLAVPMLPDGATEAASRPEGRLAVGCTTPAQGCFGGSAWPASWFRVAPLGGSEGISWVPGQRWASTSTSVGNWRMTRGLFYCGVRSSTNL